MRIIQTHRAPQPAGHYSQGVVHGGVVYVAGQLAIDPANPDAAPGGVEAQVRRAMANVEAVLEAAGSSLSELLHVTIFLTDLSLWREVNRVYAEIMGAHRPARAVVPCGAPKPGFVLEITAVAAVGP